MGRVDRGADVLPGDIAGESAVSPKDERMRRLGQRSIHGGDDFLPRPRNHDPVPVHPSHTGAAEHPGDRGPGELPRGELGAAVDDVARVVQEWLQVGVRSVVNSRKSVPFLCSSDIDGDRNATEYIDNNIASKIPTEHNNAGDIICVCLKLCMLL